MPPELQQRINDLRTAFENRIAALRERVTDEAELQQLIRQDQEQTEAEIARITRESEAQEPEAQPAATETERKTSPAEEYNAQYVAHNRNPFSVPRPEVPPGYVPDPRRTGHIMPVQQGSAARQETARIAAERYSGRTPLTDKELFTEERLRPADDRAYMAERERIIAEDLDMIRRQQQVLVDQGTISQEMADETVDNARTRLEARFDMATERARQEQGIDVPVPGGAPSAAGAPGAAAEPTAEEAMAAPAPGTPTAATGVRRGGPRARVGAAPGAPSVPGAPGAGAPSAPSTEQPKTPVEIQRDIMTRMEESIGREALTKFLSEQQQAEELSRQAKNLRNMQEEEAALRLEENQAFKNQLADQQRRLNDLRRQTLDPNRLFSDRGLGTSMALGVAAGALQQTMLGILYPGANTANTALQIVNSAIERDIDAQRANLARGDRLFGVENNLLSQARELTDNDRAAREYAIGAAQEYMGRQLEAMALQSASLQGREQMLRSALQLRQEGEARIADFERQAALDNARLLAARRGRGGGGGRGAGPARTLTGEQADNASLVQAARNGTPLPGTTDLYFTDDAVLQRDANGVPTQVRALDQIYGAETAKDIIGLYQRGNNILRELPNLDRLAQESGAFTPGRQANYRLQSAMNLLIPDIAKIVSGGFAPSESDMQLAREILGDPGIFTSINDFRASIEQLRRRVSSELDNIVDRSGGNLRRGAPRGGTVRRAQGRPEEGSYTSARDELETLRAQQEAEDVAAAEERVRRQRAAGETGGE